MAMDELRKQETLRRLDEITSESFNSLSAPKETCGALLLEASDRYPEISCELDKHDGHWHQWGVVRWNFDARISTIPFRFLPPGLLTFPPPENFLD